MKRECRRARQAIWACWPEGAPVPPGALDHARACADCEAEFRAMLRLCRRAGSAGRPSRWRDALPPARQEGLAARTIASLEPLPRWTRPLRWTPAFAAAALAVALFAVRRPEPRPSGEIEVEALAHLELLEQAELAEDWEMVEALVPDQGEPL